MVIKVIRFIQFENPGGQEKKQKNQLIFGRRDCRPFISSLPSRFLSCMIRMHRQEDIHHIFAQDEIPMTLNAERRCGEIQEKRNQTRKRMINWYQKRKVVERETKRQIERQNKYARVILCCVCVCVCDIGVTFLVWIHLNRFLFFFLLYWRHKWQLMPFSVSRIQTIKSHRFTKLRHHKCPHDFVSSEHFWKK